jgi:hypothetical protein
VHCTGRCQEIQECSRACSIVMLEPVLSTCVEACVGRDETEHEVELLSLVLLKKTTRNVSCLRSLRDA